MIRPANAVLLVVLLGGCAAKGDVRRVEDAVLLLRAETTRQDSVRAAQLTAVIGMQQRILDSLAATRTAISGFKGDIASDLYSINQQLVQVQELTGQSQQRLTELRTQLEARSAEIQATAPAPVALPPGDSTPAAGTTPAGAPPAGPPAASADQMYEASLQQLRLGSVRTARMGFTQLLQRYPQSPRAGDATYFVGESWAAESPDSAVRYYNLVVQSFPKSPRAATALYKLGLLAENRKDPGAARGFYQRVVQAYPNSDEAALARDRIKTLGH
ncbi:MAG: tetratricopeptide repeat protein [Gemmatimonadales bacterium]